jgi:hypothetical protein
MQYSRLLALVLFLYTHVAFSQSEQIFLNRDFEYPYQASLSDKSTEHHDAIKPFLYEDFKAMKLNGQNGSVYYNPGFPFRSQANQNEDVDEGTLGFYPLMNLGYGYSSEDSGYSYSHLGLGASALFKYTNKITARINFSAHREQFPKYLRNGVQTNGVTPDGHVWQSYDKGYNYIDINGYLSWNVGKYFNFQVGHGKNFIGNGYRSLLLSDNAGNQSYGRILVDIWRLKYAVIYSHQKDINNTESRQYGNWTNKFSTTHYLSWNITKWLNLGVFESVVWQANDTLLNRGFDVNYLNPIIFFRPIEYSTGSSDNSILGINLCVKPVDRLQLYGQFVLDEFLLDEFMKDVKETINPGSQAEYGWWANKYGWQAGFKTFDLFGIQGLGIQSELNWVRPFTYTHSSPIQNYGHQNASNAHPLGANFMESVSFLNYQVRNWFFQLQVNWYNQGLSTDSVNYGENIYRSYNERQSEYGHVTGQGIQKDVLMAGFRASYLVYPQNNLRIYGSIRSRYESINNKASDIMLFEFGISTSLFNRYTDI